MKELIAIQSEIKVPKSQYNSFGKYKYRSCEDILEAVKPLLKTHECALNLCDDIIVVGDRYYVKATACIMNASGESATATAFAREDLDKKGMDGAQITGTASSYARKYALNGLFCIDDTKDADTDERHNENANRAAAIQNAPTAQSPRFTTTATDPIESAMPITPQPKKRVTLATLENKDLCDKWLNWAYGGYTTSGYSATFDAGAYLLKSCEADTAVVEKFSELFESYRQARQNAK